MSARWFFPEPALSRKALLQTAAVFWAGAGLMLLVRAFPWLNSAGLAGWTVGAGGLGLGILKSRLVFVPLADRNIERIKTLSPEKQKLCVFAFQTTRSYFIIASMICLGVALRLSPLPRIVLGAIYTAIGSALLFTFPRYLKGDPSK